MAHHGQGMSRGILAILQPKCHWQIHRIVPIDQSQGYSFIGMPGMQKHNVVQFPEGSIDHQTDTTHGATL